MEQGARLADPGEFSRRAFLNGRIDLTQAEAIADLIDAQGEGALRNGVAHLAGALASRLGSLRQRLIEIRAHLEVEIDFADEDVELPSREALAGQLDGLIQDLRLLHQSFARGRILRQGARVAIIGKPNVGKSSTLNLLLGTERAIVTAVPGTTRDVIEESIALGPYPLVLLDTAGIRESSEEVERIGISRAIGVAEQADILIAIFDSSRALDAHDAAIIELMGQRRGLALLNKCDLPHAVDPAELRSRGCAAPILRFSAVTADGLAQLRNSLANQVEKLAEASNSAGDVVITRERHRDALAHALEALTEACRGIHLRLPPEIIAVDVTSAGEWLGSITGVVTTEDVLDAVFRDFCIGK